jgi:hypothetical protein
MTNNVERAGSGTVPSPETEGAVAPSCYRISVLSGSLEVSARLKSADDLELLMKVLEANKGLFAKVERSATATVVNATKTSAKADGSENDTKTSAKADGSETDGFLKADREIESSARMDRIANGILTP